MNMLNSSVLTRQGMEDITAYRFDEKTFPPVRFRKKYKNKKVIQWAEDYSVFDSETSWNHDYENPLTWVYQWAFKFKDNYYYGRRPEEFIILLGNIRDFYELHEERKIIIYVHNLAFDGQFLKHYLVKFAGGKDKIKIMVTDSHAYLFIDLPGFRFLCSYRMTGLSLDILSKSYSERYLKAAGLIDYGIIRYPDTDLTPEDWEYMFSDVASQSDAIGVYLRAQGYKFAFDAPITSTGFVRADCRKASEKAVNWNKKFKNSALTLNQYLLMRQGFQGGMCILNYEYEGFTIRGKIGHFDFTSSYPARQMIDYFAVGAFSPWGKIKSRDELNFLLNKYCCVFILTMTDVELKPGVTAPFIPSSKCIELVNPLKLNGKVIKADKLSIVVTEIDFEIYKSQYNGRIAVSEMQIARRGKLPEWLKERIMYYYRNKTTLKHSDPLLYMASKAKLNGIYGMSATAIIRDEYKLTDEMIFEPSPVDKEKALNKFYRSRNSFMPYQWGVYTTAHARKALFDLILAVGYDSFLYCDTDSVFFVDNELSRFGVESYNKTMKERAIAAGAFIDEDNILGLATEEEDENLTAFRGLHAKCYAVVNNDELKVTIAGIPKRATNWKDGEPETTTNAEELKDIDNLKDGFVFTKCGGTRAIYTEGSPRKENINGHEVSISSGVIIDRIEKEISGTMWSVGADYSLLHVKQRYV